MYESFMFISVQLIALLTGLGLILTQQAPPRQGPVTNIPELASGSWQILLAFAIAVVLIFILLRFIKVPDAFRAAIMGDDVDIVAHALTVADVMAFAFSIAPGFENCLVRTFG